MGNRMGVIIPIAPRSSRLSQEMIIRQEMYISDNLKAAVRDRLVSHEGIESEDLKQFKKLFMEAYRTQDHGLTLKFDYKVSAADINRAGGTMYISELDIILSIRADNIPLHPFTLEALSYSPKSVRDNDEGGISVIIVDNAEEIGPRYIRVMGKIIKIEPTKDAWKADGVYIGYRNLITNANEEPYHYIDKIPPADIDTTGWVFKTFAEARNAPERDAELSLELKEKEIEGKRISAVTSLSKNEFDLEKLDLERKNAELQRRIEEKEREYRQSEAEMQRKHAQEEHVSKLELLRARDYYENRSLDRKDTSEWAKAFPTLLIAAGAAFVAIKSLFSN